jgi:glycosyltransferase involved in cell wall biosynthesis
MPLISVVIPVYNAEKTIREAVDSVLRQTFSDFELIIVNNSSTDTSLNIVSCVSDSRLRIFSCPKKGAYTSRNYGLHKASGEYVGFLDADDLWKLHKLEKQVEVMKNNSQISVVYCWTDYIDDCGNFLYPGMHASFAGNVYREMLLYDFIESGCSNVLIKKEVLLQANGFNEAFVNGADWDLWLRLAKNNLFAVVPSVQVLYRISPYTESANTFMFKKCCLEIIEKNFQQAPENMQYLKSQSIINFHIYQTRMRFERFLLKHKNLIILRLLWHMFLRNTFLRKKINILQPHLSKFWKC